MLSLGCNPLAQVDDDNQEVTNSDIGIAISSILEVEKRSLSGDSLTEINQCYLCLVKSDLKYRQSQFDDNRREKYIKEARDWATKARYLADKYQFKGIVKYAQRRLDRFAKTHISSSSVEDDLIADLNNY